MDADLQRCYQPAMLKGMISSVVLFAIVGAAIKLLDAPLRIREQPSVYSEGTVRGHLRGGAGHGRRESRVFAGGFIDRRDLRIIPEESPRTPRVTAASLTHSPDLSPVIIDGPPDIGACRGNDFVSGDVDFGLPTTPSLIAIRRPMAVAVRSTAAPELHLRKPDRPLTIYKFVSPDPPWKTWGIRGIATVRIVVDKRGHLASMVIEREDPPNMGFGAALSEALSDCYYEPAIVEGKAAAMQVTVTYEFNAKEKPEIRTKGNVIFFSK